MGIIGLSLSVRWLIEQGIDTIFEKEKNIVEDLINIKLKTIPIKKIYRPENHVGIVSCVLEDYTPKEAGIYLGTIGIAVRTGLHCAYLAHKHMGTLPVGTVRLSIGYFTN